MIGTAPEPGQSEDEEDGEDGVERQADEEEDVGDDVQAGEAVWALAGELRERTAVHTPCKPGMII